MSAVDLRRELPGYTARRNRFDVLEIPPQHYLMIDGEGDPNTEPAYVDAVSTLYPVAYTLKALGRDRHGRDARVMPLEAAWWADDPAAFTSRRDKSRWRWTVMILVPAVVRRSRRRGRVDVRGGARTRARLADLRYDCLDEGLVVQTLHVGPYDEEGPVLAVMHAGSSPSGGSV